MIPQSPPCESRCIEGHDLFQRPLILIGQINDLSLKTKGSLISGLIPGVIGLLHEDIRPQPQVTPLGPCEVQGLRVMLLRFLEIA